MKAGQVKAGKRAGSRPDGPTVEDVVEILTAANPKKRRDQVVMYAQAFVEYRDAQANIEKNGTIVFHPRTGSPIENPYLRIRDRASLVLTRIRLDAALLWT